MSINGTMMKVSPRAPNLVMDEMGNFVGIAIKWNPTGLGECIVQYFDGSADSAIFAELEFPNGSGNARAFLDAREH